MHLLAIHGSPRVGGNTDFLLQAFLEGFSQTRHTYERINLYELKFSPCIECGECDYSGECIIEDDMQGLYQKYLASDILVISAPIFFYSHPSMVQAFFERFQVFWARKYLLKERHPFDKSPKGILLSLGATQGKKIFESFVRTFKYVMDAGWGKYIGGLFFRKIDKKGEILSHPEILEKVKNLGIQVGSEPEESWNLNRDSTP